MTYNIEERIGVYSVGKMFVENFGWIFREQPINDFGIDGFVEITKKRNYRCGNVVPTGRLIGVQIKSGKSFFKEDKGNFFIFRGSKKHLEYWLNHSIPVVVVLFDKDSNCAYWQEITESTITLTSRLFKTNIPKKNLLNRTTKENLTGVGYFKNKYEYKFWQLSTSIEEINLLLRQDLFLYINIESISNNDEYYIGMLLTDEKAENYVEIFYRYEDENPNRYEYFFYLSKNMSLKEAINDILPWADISYNNETFTDELFTEILLNEILGYEVEEFINDILEFKKQKLYLRMACHLCDNYWFKLELRPNDLTNSFLTFHKFLEKEPSVRQRVFYAY